MTEQEWDSCSNPVEITSFLGRKISERKSRLVAVACCRRIWSFIIDERSRCAIETAELHADGLVPRRELIKAKSLAQAAAKSITERWTPQGSAAWAVVWTTAGGGGWRRALETATTVLARAAGDEKRKSLERRHDERSLFQIAWDAETAVTRGEQRRQCDLLRDILPNPFRAVDLSPSCLAWNDATIVKLAQAIYDDRALPSGHLDSGRLAILADAVEEAGSHDGGILSHLRAPGDHLRGCWGLDLLLGKE